MKSISIYTITRNQNIEQLQKLERQLSGRDYFLKMREWERIVFSSYREGYEAKLELLRFCLVQPSSVTYHLLRQSCDVLSRSRRVPICGRLRVLSPPGPIILPLLTCRRLVCRHNVHTTYYHLRTSSSRSLLTN